MTDIEKRQLNRFEMKIPALVNSADRPLESDGVFLHSRDLSGDGGFFSTVDPFPVDSEVKVGLILDFHSSNESVHERYSLIEVKGTVLRTEPVGMAIGFLKKFKIFPI